MEFTASYEMNNQTINVPDVSGNLNNASEGVSNTYIEHTILRFTDF